jgi:voltage-gated potassium channel
MLAIIVLSTASVAVLQFESRSPDANIVNGGDALWWAVVTITTVGYGDRFPVTALGRLTGVGVMVAGIGIIGALASIFASALIPPAPSDEPDGAAATATASGASERIERDLQAARAELDLARADLSAVREDLAALRASMLVGAPPGAPGADGPA